MWGSCGFGVCVWAVRWIDLVCAGGAFRPEVRLFARRVAVLRRLRGVSSGSYLRRGFVMPLWLRVMGGWLRVRFLESWVVRIGMEVLRCDAGRNLKVA